MVKISEYIIYQLLIPKPTVLPKNGKVKLWGQSERKEDPRNVKFSFQHDRRG